MEAIEEAQAMDRHSVRNRAAEEFDTDQIVDSVISSLDTAHLRGGIETAQAYNHGHGFPDSLDDIDEEYTKPTDFLTRNVDPAGTSRWHYDRIGPNAYRLYVIAYSWVSYYDALPARIVVRLDANAGDSDSRLKETWEFSSGQVHRVVIDESNGPARYRRERTLGFDTKNICRQLLDGKLFKIEAAEGTGKARLFAGTAFEGSVVL